jgi:hypothetical protein
MDPRPIVFAVVLGWVTGHENLPPTFVDWLAAGQAKTLVSRSADCTAVGVDFVLRQPNLDFVPVPQAETP